MAPLSGNNAEVCPRQSAVTFSAKSCVVWLEVTSLHGLCACLQECHADRPSSRAAQQAMRPVLSAGMQDIEYDRPRKHKRRHSAVSLDNDKVNSLAHLPAPSLSAAFPAEITLPVAFRSVPSGSLGASTEAAVPQTLRQSRIGCGRIRPASIASCDASLLPLSATLPTASDLPTGQTERDLESAGCWTLTSMDSQQKTPPVLTQQLTRGRDVARTTLSSSSPSQLRLETHAYQEAQTKVPVVHQCSQLAELVTLEHQLMTMGGQLAEARHEAPRNAASRAALETELAEKGAEAKATDRQWRRRLDKAEQGKSWAQKQAAALSKQLCATQGCLRDTQQVVRVLAATQATLSGNITIEAADARHQQQHMERSSQALQQALTASRDASVIDRQCIASLEEAWSAATGAKQRVEEEAETWREAAATAANKLAAVTCAQQSVEALACSADAARVQSETLHDDTHLGSAVLEHAVAPVAAEDRPCTRAGWSRPLEGARHAGLADGQAEVDSLCISLIKAELHISELVAQLQDTEQAAADRQADLHAANTRITQSTAAQALAEHAATDSDARRDEAEASLAAALLRHWAALHVADARAGKCADAQAQAEQAAADSHAKLVKVQVSLAACVMDHHTALRQAAEQRAAAVQQAVVLAQTSATAWECEAARSREMVTSIMAAQQAAEAVRQRTAEMHHGALAKAEQRVIDVSTAAEAAAAESRAALAEAQERLAALQICHAQAEQNAYDGSKPQAELGSTRIEWESIREFSSSLG